MRLVIVQRLRLFGFAQIVATFQAEFTVRGYALAAARTDEFELCPALFAELGAAGKFDLALWAFHSCPPLWNVEEGGLLKALGPAKTPHDGMNND